MTTLADVKLAPEQQRERWERIIDCTVEIHGQPNFSLIDARLISSLIAYRDNGTPVGTFLDAVLSNNLIGALMRAEAYERATIYHLVMWLYWEMPTNRWGSAEKYRAWIYTKFEERQAHFKLNQVSAARRAKEYWRTWMAVQSSRSTNGTRAVTTSAIQAVKIPFRSRSGHVRSKREEKI